MIMTRLFNNKFILSTFGPLQLTNFVEQQPAKKPQAISKKCNRMLAGMRENPQSDWQIGDIETLCENVGINFTPPTRGSHYKISSDLIPEMMVTIPYNRPIKAPYIRLFVKLIDAHIERCVKGGER